ncbi:hypothetical protein AB6A40_003833 [Gnathostoma spinigerum]|uniref:Uncharacterized protein n=1 Tax=Gnathostoma spinigerum TaxID=75299 RepID=A0ABD6EG70_9BILA
MIDLKSKGAYSFSYCCQSNLLKQSLIKMGRHCSPSALPRHTRRDRNPARVANLYRGEDSFASRYVSSWLSCYTIYCEVTVAKCCPLSEATDLRGSPYNDKL